MSENILRSIEKGTFMIRENKKRSEEIFVRLRLESRQIVVVNKNIEADKKGTEDEERVIAELEQIVDIRNSDYKTIFIDNANKRERIVIKGNEDNVVKHNLEFKFSIVHGFQFNLKIISLRAPDTTHYMNWLVGLQFLVEQQSNLSYETRIESWLWKQYYEIGEKVVENCASYVMEIDDESIATNIDRHCRSSSLANLTTIGNKEIEKNDKVHNIFSLFSHQQRNMSTSDLNGNPCKNQAIKSSMPRKDSQISINRSSKKLNMTHFRRYSWCSNICSADEFCHQRRFASTDYHSCNKLARMFDIKISPKQLRVWLAQQNGNKVDLDFFKEYGSNYRPKPNFVDFNGFTKLYKDLLYRPDIFLASIQKTLSNKSLRKTDTKIKTNEIPSLRGLNKFDENWIRSIYDYNDNSLLNFDLSTLDKCFNPNNSIWDTRRAESVYQDMDQPLSEYFISSSHNTYLTGDQITSKSSCEAYIRCIQMGCRSVELDCWNGDSEPIIYHGNTLTSKIALVDVLRTIKKYAWKYSSYPLILSLEDHCEVQQQTIIAQMMQEIFQDDLLTAPITCRNSAANQLPSPNQLRKKIILKHKKLNIDGFDGHNFVTDHAYDCCSENDMERHLNHGRMYMKDLFLDTWIPYYFLLSPTYTLSYSEDNSAIDRGKDVNVSPKRKINRSQSNGKPAGIPQSQYFVTIDQGEKLSNSHDNKIINGPFSNVAAPTPPWYYGAVSRSETNSWLKRHWFMGDGTFLIRDSETFTNNFSLSFYRKDNIHHVRLCRFYDDSSNKLLIGFEHCDAMFSTIEELVRHYQVNDMVALEFNVRLKNPPPEQFNNKSWFYENPPMNKKAAEELLNQMPFIGSFLVRRKTKKASREDNSSPDKTKYNIDEYFVLSYKSRSDNITHCSINYDGFKYSIHGRSTYSLVELVEYLSRDEIIEGIKLRYPADVDLIKKYNTMMKRSNEFSYGAGNDAFNKHEQVSHNSKPVTSILRNSTTADNLLNLQQQDNCNRQQSTKSPRSYFTNNSVTANGNPLGNMERGNFQLDSDCFVKLVDEVVSENFRHIFPFDLFVDDFRIQLGCETDDQRSSWMSAINSCLDRDDYDSDWHAYRRKNESQHQIAKSLSDLIIYCSSVPFNWPENSDEYEQLLRMPCSEMSSFNENKFFKLLSSKPSLSPDDNFPLEDTTKRNDVSLIVLNTLIKYHATHLSRVYPKATRLDSSNLSPIIPWLSGVQMAALNFQTPDRSLQINQGLFRDNGGCGYILRNYRVFEQSQYLNNCLTFLGARHLPRVTRGLLEIEIISAYEELCDRKVVSLRNEITVMNNDIPDIIFQIKNPDFSFIRFSFGSEEKISQIKRLNCCQTTFPVRGIQPGIRAVHLRNGFDILYELATLLFDVDMSIHTSS